ncbi:MAG: TlpA disulfide reductase family protein [Gilvibacter sp.]
MQQKSFLRKHWSTLAMLLIVVVLLVPQTAIPIKVALNRAFAFSPATEDVASAATLTNYDWTLISLDGVEANLSNSEQKVVLINLWATWCPPCIAEMPSLQALYDSYGDKVQFYFITNESTAVVRKFLDKHSYTFPVYLQKFSAPAQLASNALPTTYLIDKNGLIRIEETGVANWNSDKVKGLIDQLLVE